MVPALLEECCSRAIPEVAVSNGEGSRDAQMFLSLRIKDADLHEGWLALEEAMCQLAERRLVAAAEWEAEEHGLTLECLFLLCQEELDMIPDPTHRHVLQSRGGHVAITNRN